MSRLNSLLQNLHIRVVTIIENEFSPVTTCQEALSRMLLLNDTSFLLFSENMEVVSGEVAEALKKFRRDFNVIEEHDLEIQKDLLSTGEIEEYLSQIDVDKSFYKTVYEITETYYEKAQWTFLKYGICSFPLNYSEIMEGIDEEYVKIIYNECPVPNNYDEFYKTIENALSHTESRFCLAMIDKIFADNSTGEDFIKDLVENGKTDELKMLSFLITSKPNDTPINLLRKEDYFIREVSKSEDNIIGKIEKYIAQCASAILFENFSKSLTIGAELAFKLSMKSEKNISNILAKAHDEGVSPYHAMNSWFQLVTQYYAEEEFLKDIRYTIALSKFYTEIAEMEDVDVSTEILPELREISRYELFDFKVNEKCLPIGSGDIFRHGNRYYLLIGQQCDLSLRLKNERNYSLAELVELKLSRKEEPEGDDRKLRDYKKIAIDINHYGTKKIHLKKFDFNGKKRVEISLTQKKINYLDFRILDTCMVNTCGTCKLTNNLSTIDFALLPNNKREYFSKIQEMIELIEDKNDTPDVQSVLDLLESNHLIKITDFEKIGEEWHYPIQRITRIKPKIMNKISEEVIDYKSRVALDFFEEDVR